MPTRRGIGVSVLRVDLSAVRAALDALASQGITDLRGYLDEHPEFAERATGMLRVQDASDSALEMFGASSKEEILSSVCPEMVSNARAEFCQLLIAIACGEVFVSEIQLRSPRGEPVDVLVTAVTESYDRAIIILLDLTHLKRAKDELADLNRHLHERIEAEARHVHQLTRMVFLAEREERERIAQLLHDDLQQRLYALGLTIEMMVDTESPAERHRLYDEVREMLDGTVHTSRTLSNELDPVVLRSGDIAQMFDYLKNRKKENYGLDVDIDIRGELPLLEQSCGDVLYHVLRELLFNVVKHAGVLRAQLTACEDDGSLRVEVKDNGAGFRLGSSAVTASRKSSRGVEYVRSRVMLMAGQFHIVSQPGEGTCVILTLPLSESTIKSASEPAK